LGILSVQIRAIRVCPLRNGRILGIDPFDAGANIIDYLFEERGIRIPP
jgi:hypothetical protein